MTPRIRQATASEHALLVRWDADEPESSYPWHWLRDHAQDEASLDPATRQRRVDTFAIAPGLRARDVSLEADGAGLEVEWPTESATSFVSAGLLWRWRTCAPTKITPATPDRHLWEAGKTAAALPRITFDEIFHPGDAGLARWLAHLHRFGFCVVDEVDATIEATTRLAHRLAPPKRTIFGELWPLSDDLTEHEDSAYSTDYLEPHTDGTYYHDAPGLQMFNCLEFDASGGESLLVDGFALATTLAQSDAGAFELLRRVSVPGHYLEPGVHLQAERPVLRTAANGELLQVSFNNYDRAPFRLADDEMARFYAAYSAFHDLIIDPANRITIPLRPGNALIFDNWRMLHGRMGYRGRRVFHGCYHDRADFESRWRVLCGES